MIEFPLGSPTMSDEDASSGFKQLWPIVIMQRVIPGHQAPNQALLDVIARLERSNPDLTT